MPMRSADAAAASTCADLMALKVLIVGSDPFAVRLIVDGLGAAGMTTRPCVGLGNALEAVVADEPHVVVTDEDLGGHLTGLDLLRLVAAERPWIAKVLLCQQGPPRSAVAPDTVVVVKGELSTVQCLCDPIRRAVSGQREEAPGSPGVEHWVSASQAEALELLASGLSNVAIAAQRGVSLRAVESLLLRTFEALGPSHRPEVNARVVAATMWREGRICVR